MAQRDGVDRYGYRAVVPEEWEPANGAERTMLVARAREDARTYLEALVRAPLCLPPVGPSPRKDGAQQFAVWEVDGRKHLIAFTSPLAMAASTGQKFPDGALVVDYADLLKHWPDPSWRLAVNPNLPIDFLVEIAEPGRLLSTVERPATLGEIFAEEEAARIAAQDSVRENDLIRALASGDGQQVLEALVAAWVYLPTAAPVPDPDRIDWDLFPWLIVPDKSGTMLMSAFTSAARAAEKMPPDTPTVHVPLVRLAEVWPESADRLIIDPGLVGEMPLAAEAVTGLPAWQEELTKPPGSGPAMENGVLTGARRGPVPMSSPAAPVPLVKVLAPGAADGYLRLNYNRVSGFAYQAEALTDATTPIQVYQALGLISAASPFRAEDPYVYLIRWDAYCSALYPVAYGGCSEQTLDAIGGWIIEPDPFVGTGLAPGLVATPELKIDGVVLPHGAQLRKLDTAGTDSLAATWDADLLRWVTAGDQDVVEALR